jgi:hypothetical protein
MAFSRTSPRCAFPARQRAGGDSGDRCDARARCSHGSAAVPTSAATPGFVPFCLSSVARVLTRAHHSLAVDIREKPVSRGAVFPESYLVAVLLDVLLRAHEDLLLVLLARSGGLRVGGGFLGGPRLVALATLESGLRNGGLRNRVGERKDGSDGGVSEIAMDGRKRDARRDASALGTRKLKVR